MLLLMFVNAVWCEVYFLMDGQEAREAYVSCLIAADGAQERAVCFQGLLEAVGNATFEYFSCMY